MKRNLLFRVLCCSVLLLSLAVFRFPAVSAASERVLHLPRKAAFEPNARVPKAVRKLCRLETKVIASIRKAAAAHYDRIIPVEHASTQMPGSVLLVTITAAVAPKGGSVTGYKSLTIRGELWRNGKLTGTFTARRGTSGGASLVGYKGTCSMLDRCTKALGRDVAAWLRKPSFDARLGSAR